MKERKDMKFYVIVPKEYRYYPPCIIYESLERAQSDVKEEYKVVEIVIPYMVDPVSETVEALDVE